jgi:predicted small lipoprotein YifL
MQIFSARRFMRAILLVTLVSLLLACGNKGPLYLPGTSPSPQQEQQDKDSGRK